MSNSTYFVQECPTCGRRLQIRVEYLGKQLVCQHCQGRFAASDPSNVRCDEGIGNSAILRRADQLLESVDRWKCQMRSSHPR